MVPVDFLIPHPVKGMMRVGNIHDGGYVVYGSLLHKTDILLTYGVGWDTGFEEHFHRLTGRGVLMFDPTMFRGIFLMDFRYLLKLAFQFELRVMLSYMSKVLGWWIKQKKFHSKGFHFIPEGIATEKRPHFDTLKSQITRYGIEDKVILLKIDIEGDEYAVFGNEMIFSELKNINQIIIEWHDLKTMFRELRNILSHLKNEFEIVHVHGNNCGTTFKLYDFFDDTANDILLPDVLEMTLVKRNSISPNDLMDTHIKYPVDKLDYPNDPDCLDYPLDFIGKNQG